MLNDLLAKNSSGGSKLYVEDVFSTYLYTGTGSSQTITNGIDLAGNGGLVWIKSRSSTANNVLVDTVRGAYANLSSNLTTQSRGANTVTNFNSTGFTVTNDTSDATFMNTTGVSGTTYVSWTFRKTPKFFDVVSYTGNGTSQNINHSLGSVPGMVIIKRRNSTSDWVVGHRRSGPNYWSQGTLRLNTTAASVTNGEFLAATDTYIGVVNSGASYGDVNTNGATYVAYLFAHNSGGFGADGAQNVISCGSFTTSNGFVNLDFEPQFFLYKNVTDISDWIIADNMRGWNVYDGSNTNGKGSNANTNGGEYSWYLPSPGSKGVTPIVAGTYIYLAIRRGPMRVPTDATKVFNITTRTGTNTATTVGSILTDSALVKKYNDAKTAVWADRLRGAPYLQTAATSAEATSTTDAFPSNPWDVSSGFRVAGGGTITNGFTNYSGDDYANYAFRRAPGFFDVTCYSGTGAAQTISHNLGVAPELMIVKSRSITPSNWQVYVAPVGNTKYLTLDTTDASVTASSRWNNTTPTNAVFTLGVNGFVNQSGSTYVAYLFASCPGVSKVGSYTGTGTTQQINCGFTAGARFVLIKRTDSTGDWYVWDTARGIVAGNDPYLLLNSTAAEVTNTDYVDAYSAGFELSSTAPAALNANGGTYIYLAIA